MMDIIFFVLLCLSFGFAIWLSTKFADLHYKWFPNSTTELYFLYGFIGVVCWGAIWLVILKTLNLLIL